MDELQQQCDAIRGAADLHRAKLCRLYDQKSRIRAGFKNWQRDSALGRVVRETFQAVLGQEVYNRAHWRNTAQMMVSEAEECAGWGYKDLDQFVYRAVKGEECNAVAIDRIRRQWPKLGAVQGSQQWMDSLMKPFRSAVVVEVAVRISLQALELPCEAGDDGSAEWHHLLRFASAADLVHVSDAYETAVQSERAGETAAERLKKWAAQGDRAAAYYYAAWGVAGRKPRLPPDVISGLLKDCAEAGMVPACIALASLQLEGRCGVGRDATNAKHLLRESLEKGEVLQYPVAAYLLARAADGVYGGVRQHRVALRWYQECSSLIEAAEADGRGFHPGGGRLFPFFSKLRDATRMRSVATECEMEVSRLERELRDARDRQRKQKERSDYLRSLRQSPYFAVYATFAALILICSAILLTTDPASPVH